MLEYALVEGYSQDNDFGEEVWLEALPARIYHTPQYGEVAVTTDRLERMVQNFKANVRGQEVAVNFDHGMDRAKGNKAAGWFTDFEVVPSSDDPKQMSLRAKVKFTDEAEQEIKGGAWRYFSMEWDDEWMDNNGGTHQDVIVGGAITNRPIAKNMSALPVNFSEQKQFAVWSTAYKNKLPDSAFLYQRHLPYKNAEGKVDLPHLRNAISRLAQKSTGSVGGESWLSEGLRTRLLARARSILSAHSKSMSEEVANAIEVLDREGFDVLDESKEWEHSEPGSGTPPAPRTDEDGSDDPAIREKWRRDPLPLEPGTPGAPSPTKGEGILTEEELAKLREALGLKADADVDAMITTAATAVNESKKFSEAMSLADEDKRFAEQYPTRWAEHQKMLAESRENNAKTFSESVKQFSRPEGEKFILTDKGLSALAIDKVREVHMKFSEGTATVADFEDAVKTIVTGGLVDFAEVGTSREAETIEFSTSTAEGIMNARVLFAEKVARIQAEDSLEYMAAIAEAAKRYPDLAKAYHAAAPA
jgi:Mu-like prophage I protein